MNYKGYLIKPANNNPKLYSISTEGKGGKIPNCMTGLFTTRTIAMKEVDRYLETRGTSNAKECGEV